MEKSDNIVLTGLGLIGPFGDSEEALADGLAGDQNFFVECSLFDTRHRVAEVRDFQITRYVKNKRAERTPRISQFALAASAQAISSAGLDRKLLSGEETAIVYGTGNGPAVATERSLDALATSGLGSLEPLVFQESVINAPASLVSIHFGIQGPVIVQPMGWTAGAHAMKQGYDLLRLGKVKRVIVICADELARATHEGLARLGFVSPNDDSDEGVRPFDSKVNGSIYSEGGVALVMERESEAIERGAKPRARISGCAIGCDTLGPKVGQPRPELLARVIRQGLNQAGKDFNDVDHILAGSFVTRGADQAELDAFQTVFGERRIPCPVTSIKSTIGEAVGPSSLFSVATGLVEIEKGQMFANRHSVSPELNGVEVLLESRTQPVQCVLASSIGPTGAAAAVIIEAIES